MTSFYAPLLITRLAVSPPPIIDTAPYFVRFTTLFSRPSLPFEKLGNSNTPTGPFQKMELARWTTLSNYSTDLGPLSKISHPSGTLALSTIMVSALLSNF